MKSVIDFSYIQYRKIIRILELTKYGAVPEFCGEQYLHFLSRMHNEYEPSSYLEIGVRRGESLKLAKCSAIGIDPQYSLSEECITLRNNLPTFLFSELSDAFFRSRKIVDIFKNGIDMAFIDGDHRFEFALRDLMNIEKFSNLNTMVFIHDCCPTNIQMASRKRRRFMRSDFATMGRWTGDGWKLLPILSLYRPDLRVIPIDCPPTGLLLITNLNSQSSILEQNYTDIIRRFTHLQLDIDRHRQEFPLISSIKIRFDHDRNLYTK